MSQGMYQDEAAIREVVEKFERCMYAPAEFTHPRHLTVACWYLTTFSPEKTLVQMRGALQRFSAHHGKQGYHETITRFWVEVLAEYLAKLPPSMPLIERVNSAVDRYGHKDVLFSHYTRERVLSEAARQEWIEPDLRAIGNPEAR
jgi:hypothetical protein